MHNGSKRMKSAKDVPFWGLSQKVVTLTPTSPQIQKILHYKSRLFFPQNTHKSCR